MISFIYVNYDITGVCEGRDVRQIGNMHCDWESLKRLQRNQW
jgi:hypothetical protein